MCHFVIHICIKSYKQILNSAYCKDLFLLKRMLNIQDRTEWYFGEEGQDNVKDGPLHKFLSVT